ncbi:hypothetical protein ACROYT_G034457 [Oculina patagonica]
MYVEIMAAINNSCVANIAHCSGGSTPSVAIWRKANSAPVCIGTRNTQYGTFNAPATGKVAAVKLVHLYGYVSCHSSDPNNWSMWGCGGIRDYVNMVITAANNHILLPPTQFMQFKYQAGKWSKIPGYGANSPELVLSRFSGPFFVIQGHQHRVWYGEDLAGYTESDNGGRVCTDVWVLYVLYKGEQGWRSAFVRSINPSADLSKGHLQNETEDNHLLSGDFSCCDLPTNTSSFLAKGEFVSSVFWHQEYPVWQILRSSKRKSGRRETCSLVWFRVLSYCQS